MQLGNSSIVPVVMAFDDNYALPASVALISLLANKKNNTHYEIYVLYENLKQTTIKQFNSIHEVHWIHVDHKFFEKAPCCSLWPSVVYYRLLIPTLIPEWDKIIWTDVDVLFTGDLSDIYHMDLEEADWAGIVAEKQSTLNGVHKKYSENINDLIYMSGFMVINAKKWRTENKLATFFNNIEKFKDRLEMFDLEILNLSCSPIKSIPFNYCVLENIYNSNSIQDAKEYVWLSDYYSDQDLLDAKNNPIIIHYAGCRTKIWKRYPKEISNDYWNFLIQSPFYKNDYYYPCWGSKVGRALFWVLLKICPSKKTRIFLRNKARSFSVFSK